MSGKVLRIILDQSGRLYHPGDIVTGNVCLDASEQVNVDSIFVAIEGRAKTKIRRRQGQSGGHVTHRGLVILFRQGLTLFKGPFTLKPGSMQWPFQFQIPERRPQQLASVDDLFEYGWSRGRFDDDLTQTLPPSMQSELVRLGPSASCYVSYCLTAKLSVPGIFQSNRDDACTLQVEPYRIEAQPGINVARSRHGFCIRTLHLLPEAATRSLNFKERMKTMFKNSQLPQSTFSIHCDLPEGSIMGEPVNARLDLKHNPQLSSSPELPVVHLTKFNMILTSRKTIICSTFQLFGKNNDIESWTQKHHIVSWTGKAPIAETLDISAMVERVLRIPHVTPTFKTFNIGLEYSLEAEFAIECAKQRESARSKVSRFVIYPSESHDPMLPNPEDFQEQPPPIEPVEEQLPAYRESDETVG